ncbi:MAG: Fe-S cluster assembly ATPase SufC [Candidatus Hydrothermales bacterium]
MNGLLVKDLYVSVEGKEILSGLNIYFEMGKIHAIMGPNGSGKTTLGFVIMGHPKYEVKKGEIIFKNKNLIELKPDERAALGIFLGFQYPYEIRGISFQHFVWRSILSLKTKRENSDIYPRNFVEFKRELRKKIEILGLEEKFSERDLNVGFSGGEKKRAEVLQMLLLKPEFAILDEVDSGLDIDSVKLVAKAIESMRSPNFGAIIITHYQRILNYIRPDKVYVMVKGKIVKEGGPELVEEVERKGYKIFENSS